MPYEPSNLVNSILDSVKKALGLVEYEFFDPDLIMHINTVFADLNQIGVGPENGFRIEDATAQWSDYISDDVLLNNVKSYMVLRVRLLFDPPSNSFVLTSYEKQIQELTYRMYVLTDNRTHQDSGEEGES